jgi:hypothetical protein
MFRHGTLVNEKNEALEFRYGVLALLSAISSDYFFDVQFGEIRPEWPYRPIWTHFEAVVSRLGYSLQQLDRSAALLVQSRGILEDPENQIENLVDRPISEFPPLHLAWQDLALYSDSCLHYLKNHADMLALAISYLYHPKSPGSRSYTKHSKWFTINNPEVDPGYADILERHAGWYHRLAGHENDARPPSDLGLRNVIEHRPSKHSQMIRTEGDQITVRLGLVTTPSLRQRKGSEPLVDNGWFSENILDDLKDIVEGCCSMLDELFLHLVERLRPLADRGAISIARVIDDDPPYAAFTQPASSPTSFNHWLFPRVAVEK